MFIKFIWQFALTAALVGATCATAAGRVAGDTEADACVTAYAGTLATYSYTDVVITLLSTKHAEICSNQSSASSSSMDAGLQAIIYGVPVIGSWAQSNSVTSNASFCKADFKQLYIDFHDQSHMSQPVIQAQKEFNECEQIVKQNKVVVRNFTSSSVVTFTFEFFSGDPFTIQGINSGTFTCSIPGIKGSLASKSTYTHTGNFSMNCTRRGTKQADGNLYYPYAHLSFATSQGAIYDVVVDADTIYGPADQRVAEVTIDGLRELASIGERFVGAKIELHPFYDVSGDDGGAGLKGDFIPWGDLHSPGHDWKPDMVYKYCKNRSLLEPQVVLAANPPGNCCGNEDFVLACVIPRPEPRTEATRFLETLTAPAGAPSAPPK